MPDYKDIARAVFDNIDFTVSATDASGIVVLLEGRGLRGLGLTPGQLVGQSIFELYRDDPALLGQLQRVLAGESLTYSTELGGHMTESRMAPLYEDGAPAGLVAVTFEVGEQHRARQALEQQAVRLREQAALLDLAHDAILVRGRDGVIRYWNEGAARMYGYTREDAVGRDSQALLRAAYPRERAALERELDASGYLELELTHTRRDGAPIVVSSRWALQRDAADTVLEINTDITARKQAEAAQAERQEELIRAQAQAIAELSTPLIPITDDILVMPLIGVMDPVRAGQVMESLLAGLAERRGRVAILDITGVPFVDTEVAAALLQAAHAARLLGAEVVITGIRPEVAQTLVAIDVNLGPVITRGTLQSGIQYALGRRELGARVPGDR